MPQFALARYPSRCEPKSRASQGSGAGARDPDRAAVVPRGLYRSLSSAAAHQIYALASNVTGAGVVSLVRQARGSTRRRSGSRRHTTTSPARHVVARRGMLQQVQPATRNRTSARQSGEALRDPPGDGAEACAVGRDGPPGAPCRANRQCACSGTDRQGTELVGSRVPPPARKISCAPQSDRRSSSCSRQPAPRTRTRSNIFPRRQESPTASLPRT